MKIDIRLALSLLLGAAIACGDDTDGNGSSNGSGNGSGGLEITGVWASNFGFEETITDTTFNGTPIATFDNAANVLITRNPDDAEFNPGQFSRIVWTDVQGDFFHYCFVEFALPTLEDALASDATADASDPDAGGCGNFAWTRLRQGIGIRGTYESSFGGMETVTSTIWNQGLSPMRIADWSEEEGWVVTQNADDADFNPSQFNRIEFTTPEDGRSFYYCFVDFALESLQAALDSTATADDSDPENGGCGGQFPWTRLDPL